MAQSTAKSDDNKRRSVMSKGDKERWQNKKRHIEFPKVLLSKDNVFVRPTQHPTENRHSTRI
jgi:hypothetical protein